MMLCSSRLSYQLPPFAKSNRRNYPPPQARLRSRASHARRPMATQMQVVPYRGVAPALQHLMAGHVDLLFVEMAGALPYLREGKLRAYALLSRSRSSVAPEIPTIE